MVPLFPTHRRRDLIVGTLKRVALVGLVLCLTAARAAAQDQLKDFTKPILVFNSGGHHAPVRSLVFTPDGTQLLSGGYDKVVNVWGLGGRRPSLDATIRPLMWRGPMGRIYAMALSPRAVERAMASWW